MRDSKDRFFLIIIMTLVLLLAIVLIMWVHNSTDSLMNNLSGNNQTTISSASHICTDEEKQAKICTMEYMPVCGNDNKTYGNGCGACSADIESWVQGEC